MSVNDRSVAGPARTDAERIADVAAGDTPNQAVPSSMELVSPEDIIRGRPVDCDVQRYIGETRRVIQDVLVGRDPRLLVVVGPCSIHDPHAAMVYARWLETARKAFERRLVIVMRVYVEKPRTCTGWKGLVNDPYLDGTCRVNDGLQLARSLMYDISALGVPVATEFVNPATAAYLADLVSWAAIGARTSESQLHRELASALPCPVGFKNGTTGDIEAAVNAVVAARAPQVFVGMTRSGRGGIIRTRGNPYCHVVLRGGVSPNYHSEFVHQASEKLRQHGANDRILVDCSHGNAVSRSSSQALACEDVRRQIDGGSSSICGVMLESNLVAGKQLLSNRDSLRFGQSITDACLGLDDTADLLAHIAESGVSTPTSSLAECFGCDREPAGAMRPPV